MGYSLWIEWDGKHNGEGLGDEQREKFGCSLHLKKKPFLPNLTCVHTQGSFCGFGCNPIYTLADPELGLAQSLLIRMMVLTHLAVSRSLIS